MRFKLMLCGVTTLVPALLLTGCGMDQVSSVTANVESPGIVGRAFGGQQPVSGATISVLAMGTTGYGSTGTILSSTTTDVNGNFSLPGYTCPQSDTPVYLVGIGGDAGSGKNASAVLGAGLGPCAEAQQSFVILNEVTTVGLAFTLSHFFSTTLGGANGANDWFGGPSTLGSNGSIGIDYSAGIVRGNNYTIPSIIETAVGAPTQNSPGITIEAAKINTIANILAACINTAGSTSTTETKTPCGKLFNWTQNNSVNRPTDTLQAAVQMALNPTTQVANLYNLGTTTPPFTGLVTQPNDWSIGVSYTTSSLGLSVNTGTLSTLDIDSTGRIWFPSNAAGHVGAAVFDPTTQSFSGPFNTTGLVFPQQVAIDANGYAWYNDSANTTVPGYLVTAPSTTESVSLPNTNSESVTVGGDNRINVGITASNRYELANISANRSGYSILSGVTFNFPVQSIAGDISDGDAVAVTDPTSSQMREYYVSGTTSSDIVHANDDAGQVIYTGNDDIGVRSAGTGGNATALCFYAAGVCYNIRGGLQDATWGLAIDGGKQLWVADATGSGVLQVPINNPAASGSSIYLNSSGALNIPVYELLHGTNNGGTATAPYGIGVDVVGNVWVTNAGCTTTNCTPGTMTLTEIIGAGYPTITPVSAQITSGNLVGTEPTK